MGTLVKYLILLLFPILANATETQVACNLERDKAEVQASVLSAPSVVSAIGQDPTTGTKSANVGISQSFAGRSQAGLLRQAAEARCAAITANKQLDERGRWAQLSVQHQAAVIELAGIEQAILMAKANISQLDAQLTAHTITIIEHTAARQELVNLEERQAGLLRTLSISAKVPPTTDVTGLIETARSAEADAALLEAKVIAGRGWDVVVSGGVRQPFGGSATTFATVALRWSFGMSAAEQAASRVAEGTSQLAALADGGYAQTALRERETLHHLIEAETRAIASSARQQEHLRRIHASLVGIDTALAGNTRRGLELQLAVMAADEAGCQARLDGYTALLEQLK
jgi:hypothetical protein